MFDTRLTHRCQGVSGHGVQSHIVGVAERHGHVFRNTCTDENTSIGACQGCWVYVSVERSFVRAFQHQTLLGVHLRGFLRGYFERCWVEAVHIVNPASSVCHSAADFAFLAYIFGRWFDQEQNHRSESKCKVRCHANLVQY